MPAASADSGRISRSLLLCINLKSSDVHPLAGNFDTPEVADCMCNTMLADEMWLWHELWL